MSDAELRDLAMGYAVRLVHEGFIERDLEAVIRWAERIYRFLADGGEPSV